MSWCLSHWHEYHLRKQASSGQLITAYTPYPYFHVHPQSPGIPSAALALSLNLAGGNVLIYCMKCHWQQGVLSSSCSNLQMHPLQTARSDKHCSTGAGRSGSMCGFFQSELGSLGWTFNAKCFTDGVTPFYKNSNRALALVLLVCASRFKSCFLREDVEGFYWDLHGGKKNTCWRCVVRGHIFHLSVAGH